MFKNKLYVDFAATKRFEACDYYFKLVIRKAIVAVLAHEKFECDAEVSVTLCDNEYIKKLNGEFRNKDSATDVLSFPIYDFNEEDCVCVPGMSVPLGDIVISMERAAEQAKEIGHGFLEEVAFLVVHSMLHLLGYDHERSPEDEEEQCARQRAIMATIDI